MPPPWAPPTNLRGENGSSDFLPPNLSHFADPVNNFSSSPLSAAANDLSLSPHDPELSDHFSGGSWDATQNPDLAPNDPRRARIDSLQSLAEEDFYKEVQAAYGRGNSCCNRRRMVLVGMSLMFVGAAILAVVATAGRGWHWINPFAVSPLPGAVGSGSNKNNTSATGSDAASSSPEMSNPTLDHPLSQACRPTREHAERRQSCTDECAKYECCSAPADSCVATQKEDCVIYRDMCDSELMKQQQPNNNDNAGDASSIENDEEDPKDADTTDDNVAPAVAIRPADLDALCTKTSLETSEGRTLCETACRDHLCCFSLSALEGDGSTCSDDPDQQCDAYQSCANLIVEEAEDILESVEEQEADETGGDADTPPKEDNGGIILEAQVEEEDEVEEAPIDDIEMEEIENEMEEAELDIQEAEKVMEEVEEEEQNEGLDEGYQEIGRNEDLPSHEKGGRDEGRLRSLRVRNLRASAYM